VFDQEFNTDKEALEELLETIKLEGIEEFVGEDHLLSGTSH